MGAGDRNVNIFITAKDAASRVLGGLGVSVVAIGAAVAAAGVAMAAFAKIISQVTKAAAAQEEAEVRLAQALRTIGQNTREVRDDIRDFNSALQDQTTIDDQVILGVEQLLVTLGKLQGEGLKKATQGALDLAAVLGRDVTPIAQVLAKAADGDTRALKQFGIVVDETASKSEKWAQVVAKLEKIQGAAAAKGRTFSGALTRISNNFGDLQEVFGKGIARAATLREVLGFVSDEILGLTTKVEDNQTQVVSFADNLATISAIVIEATLKLISIANKVIDFAFSRAKLQFSILKFISRDFKEAFEAFEGVRADIVSAVEDIDDSIDELQERLKALRGTTIDAAEGVGNVEDAILDLSKAGEGLEELPDLGIESFDELLAKAAAVQMAFVDLESQRGEVSPEFFQATLDKLAETALQLNALGVQVRDFANVSAEEAKRLLEELNEVAEVAEERIDSMREAIESAVVDAGVRGAVQFGDALVDAALDGKLAFHEFFKALLKDIAKAIIQALILRAIMAAMGGGKGGIASPMSLFNPFIKGQHGGIVIGGLSGRDSVFARLTPGEIVLPREIADDFAAIGELARTLKETRVAGVALPRAGIEVFNRIEPRGDRLEDAIAFVEAQNELAERHGMRVVATEVIS